MEAFVCKGFNIKKDVRFLTLRGEGRFQKIGAINDLCRMISDTYFITREANKATDGFHFHAVLQVKEEPKKSWYKKGVHMHLLHVGKSNEIHTPDNPRPVPPGKYNLTKKELGTDYPKITESEHEEKMVDIDVQYFLAARRKERKMNRKEKDLESVVDYICKDRPEKMYLDYINVVNGKKCPYSPCGTLADTVPSLPLRPEPTLASPTL